MASLWLTMFFPFSDRWTDDRSCKSFMLCLRDSACHQFRPTVLAIFCIVFSFLFWCVGFLHLPDHSLGFLFRVSSQGLRWWFPDKMTVHAVSPLSQAEFISSHDIFPSPSQSRLWKPSLFSHSFYEIYFLSLIILFASLFFFSSSTVIFLRQKNQTTGTVCRCYTDLYSTITIFSVLSSIPSLIIPNILFAFSLLLHTELMSLWTFS